MRKSVVLALVAVYVVSVCVVGYFGLNVRILNPTVYTEQIVISGVLVNDTFIKADEDADGKYIYLTYADKMSVKLRYTVYPDNTTNKDVIYSYEKSPYWTVSSDGIIIFNENSQGTALTLKIMPKDGSNVWDKITIYIE